MRWSAATTLPIILGGGAPELSDRDYLASRRARIALQGHQPFAAAVKAVHDTLKALREGTPPSKLHGRGRRRADEARHARCGLRQVDEGVPGRVAPEFRRPSAGILDARPSPLVQPSGDEPRWLAFGARLHHVLD
jgi:hypothetical protein